MDVPSGLDHYVLTGLKPNSLYNISVAAITGGEDNEIIGDYVSITAMTSFGGDYDDSYNMCICTPILLRDV